MDRKTVLILGATGMAGHIIYDYFRRLDKYEIINVSYRQKLNEQTIILDVRDFGRLKSEIISLNPDYIVNAIGVLVSGSRDASNAILLNAYLPHFLESVCNEMGSKLIHISTDCVFSGNSKGGYTEESIRDADDTYGRSKALGEVINERDVTIRTSIIGPEIKAEGEGLFHWFMNQTDPIKGYANVFWSGVTTLVLAKAVEAVIATEVTGLCHLTNNEKISKYHLLKLVRDIWNKKNIEIYEYAGYSKDKSFLDTKSKISIKVPSYNEMLTEMHSNMIENEALFNYKKYYNFNEQD